MMTSVRSEPEITLNSSIISKPTSSSAALIRSSISPAVGPGTIVLRITSRARWPWSNAFWIPAGTSVSPSRST